MATWPINELAGLLDPNVFVTGYYPTGVDVGAEIAQVLNKGNETVEGANELKVGLDAEVTAGLGRDTDISNNTTAIQQAFNQIIDNTADIAALGSGILNTIHHVDDGSVHSLTPDLYKASSFFVVTNGYIKLPSGVDQASDFGDGFGTATIVHAKAGAGSLLVTLGDSGDYGYWIDGNQCTGTNYSLLIPKGSSVVVYPVDVGSNDMRWTAISGEDYITTP